MIYNIYENNKLMKKIRTKDIVSLDEIEEIICDLIYFNSEIEKDENIAELNFEYLINRKIGIKKNLGIISNELSKNEFNIDNNKFRNKEEIAKFLRKIYIEKNG